jgi:hypothetical protein
MANATGTLSSPTFPSMALAQAIASFLRTGNVTHTPSSSPPAFRASSSYTAQNATAVTTVTFPLPAAVQAGDLVVVAFGTVSPSVLTAANNPAWSLSGNSYGALLWRIMTAADITAASFTFTFTGSSAYTLAAAAYSGCDQAFPVSVATATNGISGTSPTMPAQTVQEANSLQISACATYGVPTTPPALSTGTARGTATLGAGNAYVTLVEMAEATAGTATQPTWSAGSAQTPWYTLSLVLNPANTATGTAPLGGWSLVGANVYGTANAVFKSPSASNNAGADWYLIVSPVVGSGNTQVNLFIAESVDPQAMKWNAVPIATQRAAPSGTYTWGPTATIPNTIYWTTPNIVGQQYPNQNGAVFQASVGTTNFLVAANKDGIFLSTLNAGAMNGCSFVGNFTSLVSNPALSDTVCLGVFNMLNNSVSSNYYGYSNTTRDVGQSTAAYFGGGYQFVAFWPYTTIGISQGSVNGSLTPNDVYQGSASSPIAQRVLIYKQTDNSIGYPNTMGAIRGLLPTWMQIIQQAGCAWGDTVTEGSDTLTLVYPQGTYSGGPLWIDTSAA